MSSPLDLCGCSPATSATEISNRPGLARVDYRASTYEGVIARLRAQLDAGGRDGALKGLRTREADDPTVALFDAFAIVADVLGFYQERIVNESFLRTAGERRSLLELARLIGYELGPGVAAAAWLAFEVEDRGAAVPGNAAPPEATVPAGTQVQSVPAQGELPQTFETSTELVTHADRNELRPLLSVPGRIASADAGSLYLAGLATRLEPGDVVVLAPDGAPEKVKARAVQQVSPEPEHDRTRVDLESGARPPLAKAAELPAPAVLPMTAVSFNPIAIAAVLGGTVSDSKLQAYVALQNWPMASLLAFASKRLPPPPPPPPPPTATEPPPPGFYALRSRLGVFGHNAPRHSVTDGMESPLAKAGWVKGWDRDKGEGLPITSSDSQGEGEGGALYGNGFDLDPASPRVVPGSLAVLERDGDASRLLRVKRVTQGSRADFALSGKVTHLEVGLVGDSTEALASYDIRKTTVHAESERLELAPVPLEETVAKGTMELRLDSLAVGLKTGAPLAISGEDAKLDGVRWNEIVHLREVTHADGLTTIRFDALAADGSGLIYAYRRSTMRINANVAAATHGETVSGEILGNGSGLADQRFRLARPPLTSVQGSGPTGAAGTLELRVDGIRWEEARSLFGLGAAAERYLTRRDDEGNTWIVFGDGERGAPPPAGDGNVRATYRSGIGSVGEVAAGALTLLKTRPLGIRSVVNPLAATGAENPETLEAARANAPLTVLTLDRVVSASDYEDFARAFAGIAKARAADLWTGTRRIVHVTLAGPGGAEVSAETRANLLTALLNAGDPSVEVRLDPLRPTRFALSVDVLADSRHRPEDVAGAVREALAERFSFEQREFGQWVASSEAIAAALAVEGAVDARVAELCLQLAPPGAKQVEDPLSAGLARLVSAEEIEPAQLLHLGPGGLKVTSVVA